MRAKLVVRNGQHVGQSFYVGAGESKILGRDASCEIQMYDKGLSRNHSLVEGKDGKFVLSDLGSTNGTFVNGKMIISKPLEDGDLLNVGKIELQFFLDREYNPVSSSVRIVEDLDPIGPQTIVKKMDIDSVVFKKEADLKAQLEHYQKALKTIYQVGLDINQVENLDSLYNKVMDLIMATLQAERGFLILWDKEKGEFEAVVARSRQKGNVRFQVSRTILTKAVQEDLSILSSNAMADDRFKGGQSIILNQIKSVMCVPLKGSDQVQGAIYVDSRGTSELFQSSDLELLSIIGMQAGITADRIRLNQQVLEQAKMKQALEFARNIQRSFLPEGVPDSVGLDIVGWTESCDETGGDYYDFVPYPDGRMGLGVGDVSGHGIGSALLMATARAFLRALVANTPTVGALFNQLNKLLAEDLHDDQFMTFFFAVLDTNTWELFYSSAGHEPPIIYRATRDEFEDLPSLGVPLGMVAEYEYPQAGPTQFMEGDLLVLMTDGIIETMNDKNEEFGRQRLKDVIRAGARQSANQIVRTIHQQVTEFAAGRPTRDDLTLVVVRFASRKGASSDFETTTDATQERP